MFSAGWNPLTKLLMRFKNPLLYFIEENLAYVFAVAENQIVENKGVLVCQEG